ncbi:MAG: cytochrome c [Candidatus Acidiferrum sp.]
MTKTHKVASCVVVFLAVGGVVFAAHQTTQKNQSTQPASAADTTKQIKSPYHDIYLTAPAGEVSGSDLYKQLCAGCHGEDGKGVGQTSKYCAVPPTDLTLLSKKNHGTFPEKKVTQILRYGTEKPTQTQSTTYMPVWKPLLATIHGESPELTEQRINSLTDYLKSIQPKPAAAEAR